MVKRYELGSEWCSWAGSVPAMVEDPTGDYVLHEDYEKLLAVAKELAHLVEYDLGDQVEEAALAKLQELLKC